MDTSSFRSLLLTRAMENALRQWLREHGLDRATIRAGIGGLEALYHLVEMRRLVLVTAAVTPDHPERVAVGDIYRLHEHAQHKRGMRMSSYIETSSRARSSGAM